MSASQQKIICNSYGCPYKSVYKIVVTTTYKQTATNIKTGKNVLWFDPDQSIDEDINLCLMCYEDYILKRGRRGSKKKVAYEERK